ncbi:hypothetical protein [Azomonas macrocytogenes]|nr:hypothetical protein [Azomonas macrocytogenes]
MRLALFLSLSGSDALTDVDVLVDPDLAYTFAKPGGPLATADE